MTTPQTISQKDSPKMAQFLGELNKLCKHYQYSLKATLKFNQDGVIPVISVIDIVPAKSAKKEGKK